MTMDDVNIMLQHFLVCHAFSMKTADKLARLVRIRLRKVHKEQAGIFGNHRKTGHAVPRLCLENGVSANRISAFRDFGNPVGHFSW